jgi:hypothetical protein
MRPEEVFTVFSTSPLGPVGREPRWGKRGPSIVWVQVDVELSDSKNNVLKEPVGDDADGGGATSAEHVAPNPIDSN